MDPSSALHFLVDFYFLFVAYFTSCQRSIRKYSAPSFVKNVLDIFPLQHLLQQSDIQPKFWPKCNFSEIIAKYVQAILCKPTMFGVI